jgi:hypothetical protein
MLTESGTPNAREESPERVGPVASSETATEIGDPPVNGRVYRTVSVEGQHAHDNHLIT